MKLWKNPCLPTELLDPPPELAPPDDPKLFLLLKPMFDENHPLDDELDLLLSPGLFILTLFVLRV